MKPESMKPEKLMHELGYVVRNHIEGPEVVVANAPYAPGHVLIIIAGRTVEVSMRELVNALSLVVKNSREHGVVIVTPEVPN